MALSFILSAYFVTIAFIVYLPRRKKTTTTTYNNNNNNNNIVIQTFHHEQNAVGHGVRVSTVLIIESLCIDEKIISH